VSVDPRFSALRSTNAFRELESRLPWRSYIARQPFPLTTWMALEGSSCLYWWSDRESECRRPTTRLKNRA